MSNEAAVNQMNSENSESSPSQAVMETITYDNKLVRDFAVVTMIWGIVGMLVGLIVALQIPFPELNLADFLSFGRIRPLHTNAVIFAFVGNGFFMGAYYSTARLCKTPMFSPLLGRIHFWGWQAIIVSAAITLPLGISSNKEYAELEWPIDIAITLIWVVFAVNFFMTLVKRREKHMYVALWFYAASILTVAVLHIVNSLAIPVHLFKSYSIFAGVQDALVQWWYGHNAVAFFLTTPYLGLMYYFMPKAARRPVYSYRLSIIHFWALIFLYIWAGPHHLLYSAVPDWCQTLGVIFSFMLIAPSWGGMINGLLTLRGAFDQLRRDPVLKFMLVAVTCYGMSTLEGPLMSFKSINGLTHFTDYIIGHVHIGGLGWNGMLVFGILYFLVPRIHRTSLYSLPLANYHFWLATLGILFYALAMYVAGLTQGLMWKQIDANGVLVYGNFLDVVIYLIPMHYIRALGGGMFLVGSIIGVYNLFKTMQIGKLEDDQALVPAVVDFDSEKPKEGEHWHRRFEGAPVPFLVLTLLAILVGGIVEIIPSISAEMRTPTKALVTPYTALEFEGRDLYIREGCYVCHSQMIRPMLSEKLRYGEPSRAGEHVYDHPFMWGSKRTGPDLLRIGGKYPHAWHVNHMKDPRSTSPNSIMPPYPWLLTNKLDTSHTRRKLEAMQSLGVPYTPMQIEKAESMLRAQAESIAAELQTQGIKISADREIIAMVAYLQKLGKTIDDEEEKK